MYRCLRNRGNVIYPTRRVNRQKLLRYCEVHLNLSPSHSSGVYIILSRQLSEYRKMPLWKEEEQPLIFFFQIANPPHSNQFLIHISCFKYFNFHLTPSKILETMIAQVSSRCDVSRRRRVENKYLQIFSL